MKNIPVQLLNHMAGDVTTVCTLIKIKCVGAFAGRVYGFTSLDADIVYNDGLDNINYMSNNGFAPEALESSADLSVGNTDMIGYATDTGLTIEEIRQGLLDFAEVTIYRVNYMVLGMGHEVIAYGSCGQAKISGEKWTIEFRSLAQQLKQTINNIWSLTCRAQYGDSRCKKAFEWRTVTVGSVQQSANNRIFNLTEDIAGNIYTLGVVKFLTGPNAGLEMEVDLHQGSAIYLALPLSRPISTNEQLQIRTDCDKTFATCRDKKQNVLNFRGEHLTPVSETGLGIPGAYVTVKTS
ncbi:hypothetical protein [Xanthomonas phage XAJ2]|uniref:Bacteriophage phiJL001 Gp84 C-terminal domain-containing protein n=1 Tax=Xanthomonas phage XAJ2 TaxID=1775249 RepID=A0A1I9L2F1_9CAUD|nr:hypothetical protein [Xanthomonas phage XAJ2]